MTRAVALPMYDQAPDALQTFWAGLRDHMRRSGLAGVLDELFLPTDLDTHWRCPATLLSQTCGYPFVTELSDRVRLVGTPRYSAPGCRGSDYASLIVVRRDDPAQSVPDLRERRAVINGRRSQSGYNALRALVAPHASNGRFFSEVVETGGHVRSLRAIQEDAADVAAIDCVTYAMTLRREPRSYRDLRVLCISEPSPGLPLITSWTTTNGDIDRLRCAFAAACADAELASARRALLLDGLEIRPVTDYQRCAAMEERAKRLGYPQVA